MAGWAQRLWSFEKFYHHIGQSGSVGIGYNAPASVGAALANKKYGRLSINLQNDGDLMYCPQVAVDRRALPDSHADDHAQQPLVQHRVYGDPKMRRQATPRYQRGGIPTKIDNPPIDFSKLAQSMGWYAEGPIENPNDVGPAIKRALAAVEKGQPALLDTVTQPT